MESYPITLTVQRVMEVIDDADNLQSTITLVADDVTMTGQVVITETDPEVSEFFVTGRTFTCNLSPVLEPAVAATAVLTFTGTALTDGDTVTIGSRVYTFKTIVALADQVLIGAVTASLANLKAAVNGAAGAGVTYGLTTVAHADVTAGDLTGTTVLAFAATVGGTAGNAIAKAESSTNLSWDVGTTFTGGVNAS